MFWMLNYCLDMTGNGYFDFDTYNRKSEFFGVSKRSYPYKAVNFLSGKRSKGISLMILIPALFSGRVYPNVKVFIDGRTEEYGADFLRPIRRCGKKATQRCFRGSSAVIILPGHS